MSQIPIISGIYVDQSPDFRVKLPRNLVPVPREQGISTGYLRPGDGILPFATGPGEVRGGINWRGTLYNVMGTKLVRTAADGTVAELGDVGGTGAVTLDYSFDVLGIVSNGTLHYYDGSVITQVTDPDMGVVNDALYVDGYWMTTDGTYLIVTELNDRYAVNPLKYGSSEADPDPVMCLKKPRREVYALNRYTTEVFDNVGGDNFPFVVIEGAMVPRGAIGKKAATVFAETVAFVGSGRKESPSVYLINSGSTVKIASGEVDTILQDYTEDQLSQIVVESRVDRNHNWLYVHLPDQTLVYDAAASLALSESIWYTLTTSVVDLGVYKARHIVWCYDKWISGDPTAGRLGSHTREVSTHYGDVNGWDFSTTVLYNESRGAIINDLELVCLPGRVQFGKDPVIWTSWSLDGQTWSDERATSSGKQGERQKRIAWRRQGSFMNYRIQKFRGSSDAHLAIARLEAQIEGLA